MQSAGRTRAIAAAIRTGIEQNLEVESKSASLRPRPQDVRFHSGSELQTKMRFTVNVFCCSTTDNINRMT